MGKKTLKRVFSAAILMLALLLAGAVVYAAGNSEIRNWSGGNSYCNSYAEIEKTWEDAGHESARPASITITLEYYNANKNQWKPVDIKLSGSETLKTWTKNFGSLNTSSGEYNGIWRVPDGGINEKDSGGNPIADYEVSWEVVPVQTAVGDDGTEYYKDVLRISNKYVGENSATYTVIYTDGVEDEEVFKDQKYEGLEEGTETPLFDKEKAEREGYEFTGWAPAWSATVTGDATYVAQWEKNPEPTTPTTPVTPIYYTVTYTDGVEGEEVFADQVTDKLVYGTKTPEFAGEPLRDGYTFEGWTPVVADLVTGNAIYTATWKPVENLDEPDVPLSPGITLPPDEFLDDPETPLGPAPKLTDDVDDPDQPKTGDEMPLMDLAGIMIIAIGALGAVCLTRRKHS